MHSAFFIQRQIKVSLSLSLCIICVVCIYGCFTYAYMDVIHQAQLHSGHTTETLRWSKIQNTLLEIKTYYITTRNNSQGSMNKMCHPVSKGKRSELMNGFLKRKKLQIFPRINFSRRVLHFQKLFCIREGTDLNIKGTKTKPRS